MEHPDIPAFYTNAPHPLALLRASGERPCRRRAAEERDELSAFHRSTSLQARRS
jgi:hypothetical protein